jgi:hypothetical protein
MRPMKTESYLAIICFLLLAGFSGVGYFHWQSIQQLNERVSLLATKPKLAPQKWEYKIIDADKINIGRDGGRIEATKHSNLFFVPSVDLNKLGKDGWEVAGIFSAIETVFPEHVDVINGKKEFFFNTRTDKIAVILKRQIPIE